MSFPILEFDPAHEAFIEPSKVPHPVYEIEHQGQRLAFFHPGVGAALASALLEEVIAFGCNKFIACGGCGVLKENVATGQLIVVSAAVRDEGASRLSKPWQKKEPHISLGRPGPQMVLTERRDPR
jgi:uridine phosphorylase